MASKGLQMGLRLRVWKEFFLTSFLALAILTPCFGHDNTAKLAFEEAKQQYQKQHWQDALRKVQQVLATEPRGDAYYLKGLCQQKLNEHKEAIASFEKAEQFQSFRHRAPLHLVHFQMGNSHLELRQFEKAIEHFDAALKLKENHPLYMAALGEAYERAGKEDEAKQIKAAIHDVRTEEKGP